jgi:hypothetical protein
LEVKKKLRGKKRTIATFVSLAVAMVIFLSLPGSTLALDKNANDYSVFVFQVPGYPWLTSIGISRYLSIYYYFVGSGYYSTCIVASHIHYGFLKGYWTLPLVQEGILWVDATGKNVYYANNNYVTTVNIPNNADGWYDPNDKIWGGSIATNVNLWPSYNLACDGVMEVFSNGLPYYSWRTLRITF